MAQAKPTLDRKAAEQINLNVLKRLDSQVEELIATAGHVALYDFDVPTRRWSRKDVEGSLFLVKRRGTPRFQIIILNKKSADNYVEDVGGGFQCELNPPYLLYRNKLGEVVGIWFYEEEDCKRMSDIITKISATFAAPSDAEAGVGTGSTASSQPTSPVYAQPSEATDVQPIYNGHAEVEEPEDDGIFWDKKVKVPAEVNIPGMQQGQQAEQTQQQPSSGNTLAGLFAGIKIAPAPAAPKPTAVPLLTPQFLQQQSSVAPPAAAPAASSVASGNQGALLLQAMRSAGSVTAGSLPPASAAPAAQGGSAKVSALLKALAENDTFCAELAKEMKNLGIKGL